MANLAVTEPQRIYLNGNFYKVFPQKDASGTLRDLVEDDASIPPERQQFGNPTKIVDPYRDSIVFADWTGGIGQWYLDKPNPTRCWYGDAQLRYKGHLIPNFAVTNTDDLATPNTSAIKGLIASDVAAAGTYLMYAAFGNDIYVHTSGDESWAVSYDIASAPASVSDSFAGVLGSNRILVFAHAEGYAYKVGAAAWADEDTIAGATAGTVNIKYLAFWNDALWMISNTGQLYYSTALGTETADAQLYLPSGVVTDLFVGPDAAGESILYVATTTGLWAHDFANRTLHQTGLQLPDNANNGQGCKVWRNRIYFPSNMAIYEYDPIGGSVKSMGLDQDDGLPAAQLGIINRLEGTLEELLAIVDCNATTSGETAIYGWDGFSWQQKWREGANAHNADYLYVSSCYSSYRIWWASGIGGGTPNRKVRYMKIPTGRLNPEQIGSSFTLDSDHCIVQTPWFTAGQDHVDKIALRVTADTQIAGSGRYSLAYCRDWSESQVSIVSLAATGGASGSRVTNYNLPVTGDTVGIFFKSIKFVITILSSTSTNWADLRSLTLEYIVLPRAKRKWHVIIDARDNYDARTPAIQRTDITTARDAQTLVGFSWKGTEATIGTFVRVFKGPSSLTTGDNAEEGLIPLTLVEV